LSERPVCKLNTIVPRTPSDWRSELIDLLATALATSVRGNTSHTEEQPDEGRRDRPVDVQDDTR